MNDKIEQVLNDRGAIYGDATLVHARIAEVWSGISGHEITPGQVPLMMAGLKLVRAAVNPDYMDSYLDASGYVELARRQAEQRMVEFNQPRSVHPSERARSPHLQEI